MFKDINLEENHPLRIEGLVMISSQKPRNMFSQTETLFVSLLAEDDLLFISQMCLKIANQLKCMRLANWLLIFPKMYTECTVNEIVFESSVKYTDSSYW